MSGGGKTGGEMPRGEKSCHQGGAVPGSSRP